MSKNEASSSLRELNSSVGSDSDSEYEELQLPEIDYAVPDGETGGARHGSFRIPFSFVHKNCLNFKAAGRQVFIPGQIVQAKIVNAERQQASHLLNPYLYTIKLNHGNFEWTIKRRYKHFLHLHQYLQVYRTTLKIPMPSRRHRQIRRTFSGGNYKKALPRFPKKPEALVSQEEIPHRVKQLEDYLSNLLRYAVYRSHHETLAFLEISHLSFIHNLGKKHKEGLVKKRSGGHRVPVGCLRCCNFICCCRCCRGITGLWTKRWLVIKDTFVAYVRPRDGALQGVMLMDKEFKLHKGWSESGIRGLCISNSSRNLLLRFWTRRQAKEWEEELNKVLSTTGKDFVQKNRFDSFAPLRVFNKAQWFIDGASYFESVANALELAREEIFIADWWLSPQIILKRPITEGEKWSLDRILERKAKQGVKIFILMWKEVELAVQINSAHSKQFLVSKHPENIKVLRHPDHVTEGVLLWAHHEKIVVVDQQIAFIGGLDLCYGRWDDFQHRLTDLGSAMKYRSKSSSDLTNTERTSEISENMVSFQTVPAKLEVSPKRSIVKSASAVDILITPCSVNSSKSEQSEEVNSKYSNGLIKENTQKYKPRWKFNLRTAVKRRMYNANENACTVKNNHLQPLINEQNLWRSHSELDLEKLGVLGSTKLWIGKDYSNFIIKDFANLNAPYQDSVDRHQTPRMPWHDIGAVVFGKAAKDVARHFIQRWNFVKIKKAKTMPNFPLLMPKSYERYGTPHFFRPMARTCHCQIVRSSSTWSAGISETEDSIHKAYIHAITNAKYYIYIENQFFITLIDDKGVVNQIGTALFNRIIKAHENKETFRVYVIMPLLPGFEGRIGTNSGTAIQAVTHWNYASISRGGNSLLERLYQTVSDPMRYITFFGLRHHSELNRNLVTELIYVHSKLMIVDDLLAIIGSANINDRSMLGKRDSEIAVVMEDSEMESGKMDGKDVLIGKTVGSLRRNLFREHLSLTEISTGINVIDPISDDFYKGIWIKTATLNTGIYDKVFNCIPADHIRTFAELREYQKKEPLSITNPNEARSLLSRVQGHLVLLPLFFLCNEDLSPSVGTKEAFLPSSLWT